MDKIGLIEILSNVELGLLDVKTANERILALFSVIDCFDIDGTELSFKEQFELRMLMSTGKVKIKIVL